jgi:hypothetical protein
MARRPLRWYRPGVREARGGVRVREVVLVGSPARVARFGTRSEPPDGPAPPPPPGFSLVDERFEATFSIARYRSGAPRAVPLGLRWDDRATFTFIDGG